MTIDPIAPSLVAAVLIAIVGFWAVHGLNKSKQRSLPRHNPRRPQA